MSSPPKATTATPRPHRDITEHDEHDDSYDEHRQPRDSGLIRRSWHAMTDVMSPFSSKALASLPKRVKWTERYARADAIPDVDEDADGERPTVRDYHAINGLPPNVRIPKKIKTTVKVEPKIWFANERTWVSYLDIAILIGTLALALFNTAKDDITRYFSYAYAVISVGIIIYGYALYQRRISLIRARDPDHFDQILGPILISIILFSVVLVNFIVRVRELNREGVTIPNVMATAFALKST